MQLFESVRGGSREDSRATFKPSNPLPGQKIFCFHGEICKYSINPCHAE